MNTTLEPGRHGKGREKHPSGGWSTLAADHPVSIWGEGTKQLVTAEEFLRRWAARELPERAMVRPRGGSRYVTPDELAGAITAGLTPLAGPLQSPDTTSPV